MYFTQKFQDKEQQDNKPNDYSKTRYVVERFFAWLKCGFHRMAIRYERRAENYFGLVNIASIMMYGGRESFGINYG